MLCTACKNYNFSTVPCLDISKQRLQFSHGAVLLVIAKGTMFLMYVRIGDLCLGM